MTPVLKRRWSFSLRTLLIVTTASALLFAQYPWLEYYPFEQGPIWTVDASNNTQYDAATTRWFSGVYVPTDRFLLVAITEIVLAFVWRLHVRRQSRDRMGNGGIVMDVGRLE